MSKFQPKILRKCLGLGAVLGLGLATAGAFSSAKDSLPEAAVARVNGKVITRQALDFALERLGRKSPALTDSEHRRRALDFLVEQELLIQRGLAIGLLDSDRTVRKALAMAMIDALVADVLKHEPTSQDLRAFYDIHTAVFSVPGQIQVQQIVFPANGDRRRAKAQAEQAAGALAAGIPFPNVQRRFGQAAGVPLPDALLPLHVLPRYLGPTLSQAALALEAREISQPLASPIGYHILRVAERQPERIRPYHEVQPEVRAEYFRRKRDAALQQFLDRLRKESTILLSSEAPQ